MIWHLFPLSILSRDLFASFVDVHFGHERTHTPISWLNVCGCRMVVNIIRFEKNAKKGETVVNEIWRRKKPFHHPFGVFFSLISKPFLMPTIWFGVFMIQSLLFIWLNRHLCFHFGGVRKVQTHANSGERVHTHTHK